MYHWHSSKIDVYFTIYGIVVLKTLLTEFGALNVIIVIPGYSYCNDGMI
jgi:hypothetical protein